MTLPTSPGRLEDEVVEALRVRHEPAAFRRVAAALQSADDIPATVAAAAVLAGHRDALVGVFHVDPTPITGALYGAAATREIESPAEARELVAGAVKALRSAGVEASGTVLAADGRVLAAPLLEAFQRFNADFVITRSRGLGPLSAIARGTVSHRLIHGAGVPVLCPPPGCLDLSLARIAVGADWSPEARAACAVADRLARAHGGEVIELAVRPGRGAGTADALNLAAAEVGATLLVVGNRGHGDLAAALLGSTGFRLLEISERPVLLVRQS